MDCFFAAIEIRDKPELQDKPVIIGADPREGQGRGVVSTANYEARKYGIGSATPISRAYKACPHGVYIRPRFSLYVGISKKIMEILRKYSMRFQKTGLDEAFLDISYSEDFEEAQQLAIKIKKEIFEKTKLPCSIGIADNKLVAKIASDFQKPNGLVVIKDNKKFLDPLPIRKLYGVGKKTEPKLVKMGIETIGDCANFNKEKLMKRFGIYGLYLIKSANGISSDHVSYDPSRASISKERTFFKDSDDFSIIHEKIDDISAQITEIVHERNYVIKTVSIKIRMQNFTTFTRAKTLDFFTNNAKTISKTAKELTKEFVGNKIRLIGVRVSHLSEIKDQTTLEQFVNC